MNPNPLGILGVDHVSWTVADLKPVIEFYGRAFGAAVVYEIGPVDARDIPRDSQGFDWTGAHLGITDARLSLAMLQLPGDIRLELFSYQRPASATGQPPKSNDIGGHHLGIAVQDIEHATAWLTQNGCTVFNRIAFDEGPTAGTKFHYFRDPWGNTFELAEHSSRASH